MTIFQLDENINDDEFAEKCNREKLCDVYRFPRRLKGQKDDVVLPDLLTKGAPLVTKDFRIANENSKVIPTDNSGLIVVRTNNPQRSFTVKAAIANIARFKEKFPRWSDYDWSGIYLEIVEDEVYVETLNSSVDLARGHAVRFAEDNFANELLRRLGLLKVGNDATRQRQIET
jgi:hypothetical protein